MTEGINMGNQYMTVETAALAAADTPIPMVDRGGAVAVDRIVEAGRIRIKRAWVCFAADGAALGGGVAWVTLAGDGIGRSAIALPIGGYGGTLVTSDGEHISMFELKDLDIPVVAGSAITLNAEMNLDVGTASVIITLEIE
jgi:hypothetical protein